MSASDLPPLDARDAYLLALTDWMSAILLAKTVGGVSHVVTAQDANDRFRVFFNGYVSSLPAGMVTNLTCNRIRERIDVVSRWLYGRKSGQMKAP
jgi:hypothetical protein